jgi:SAM-dependent methyltransferase
LSYARALTSLNIGSCSGFSEEKVFKEIEYYTKKYQSNYKRHSTLILDVGCGNMPTGDVNCDSHVYDVGHRSAIGVIGKANLKPRAIPNFVLCSGLALPFKDSAFDMAYSSHVIEHVSEPFLFLKELLRVSNFRVVVKCPHRYGDRVLFWNSPDKILHLHFFSKAWFIEAIKKLNCVGTVSYSKFQCLPNELFCLFRFPLEITCDIRKNSDA